MLIEMKKQIMFVNRKAPYGTSCGAEALDAILAASAFQQHIVAVFMDDGVYQLKKGQSSSSLEIKNYSKTFSALWDFDVSDVYIEDESLKERNLSARDIVAVLRDDGTSAVSIVSSEQLSDIMERQDIILEF